MSVCVYMFSVSNGVVLLVLYIMSYTYMCISYVSLLLIEFVVLILSAI